MIFVSLRNCHAGCPRERCPKPPNCVGARRDGSATWQKSWTARTHPTARATLATEPRLRLFPHIIPPEFTFDKAIFASATKSAPRSNALRCYVSLHALRVVLPRDAERWNQDRTHPTRLQPGLRLLRGTQATLAHLCLNWQAHAIRQRFVVRYGGEHTLPGYNR